MLDKYMRWVESIDTDVYREIFRSYCEVCSKSFGVDCDDMFDKIVLRKVNMRSNIEEFYTNLTEMRRAKEK